MTRRYDAPDVGKPSMARSDNPDPHNESPAAGAFRIVADFDATGTSRVRRDWVGTLRPVDLVDVGPPLAVVAGIPGLWARRWLPRTCITSSTDRRLATLGSASPRWRAGPAYPVPESRP